MTTDSPRKAALPEPLAAGTAVPLQLFSSPLPHPTRRRGASDPTLRPLILKMAERYDARYGMPLLIAWGREMKNAKDKLRLADAASGALGIDPHDLLLDAYELFLGSADRFYQRVRHDTRIFWRDAQRFLGEAVDRRRGILALPAHQRPALLPESHRPRWMSRGATE